MVRRFHWLGYGLLGSAFLGILLYLFFNSTRTGVVPAYRFAASNWWSWDSMYPGGTHGFLYSPVFAVLFGVFHFIQPPILGELLWRAFGFGLFAFSLRALSAFGLRAEPTSRLLPPVFFALALLAVPASLASLNNGQTNLPLSACLTMAALSLRDHRWNLTALFLTLALVLKPIALAPWLLAFAVIPAVRFPLLAGIPILAFFGFLHPNLFFALAEWVEFLEKLVYAYTPENLRVSDIFGALGKTGVQLPAFLEKGIRAGACLGALAWVWQCHRCRGVAGASWALWVSTALVFTLFNPRAETNSYVLISPLLAFAAVSYWCDAAGGGWKGILLAAACVGLMCDGMGKSIYLATDVWFKPLIVLLVSPLLFRMPQSWKLNA